MSQLALDLAGPPAYRAEDFLLAEGNRQAMAWLDAWPGWPAPGLAIHGPRGCGKTHLAHLFQARSGAKLLAAAEVAGEGPEALLGNATACIVEDADLGVAEEPLLHLYNVVAERRGAMLLTGLEPPARWNLNLPDLRSRLLALPAVAVAAADDALMAAVLVKHFSDRQLRVGTEVVDFLLTHMERSFEAARSIVAALDAAALAARRNITVPLARQVLGDTQPGDET